MRWQVTSVSRLQPRRDLLLACDGTAGGSRPIPPRECLAGGPLRYSGYTRFHGTTVIAVAALRCFGEHAA